MLHAMSSVMLTHEATMLPQLHSANAILLRRRRQLIVPAGAGGASEAQVATALHNLASLGYTASPALLDRLRTLDEVELVRFLEMTTSLLRELLGADVAYTPMYPNFPAQVMEMDEGLLYLNALMHYLGDVLGERIMPDVERSPRPPLADSFSLQVIGLSTWDELTDLGRKLIGARSSISEADRADVRWFIEAFADDPAAILPAELPHKENLCFVTACLMAHSPAAGIALAAHYKTATDVLRLATALSEGDISLAKNTRFRSFSRPERRLLLSLLDRLRAPLEDMFRHKGRWIRLGERLHPSEYRRQFAKAAAAFDAVRAGDSARSFAGKVELCLVEGDVPGAVALLQHRPGELARRLDHLLRLTTAPAVVVDAFDAVAEQVATRVLLQVLTHFNHRPEPQDLRVIFPKGSTAKVITLPGERPAIDPVACAHIVDTCRAALVSRFSELEGLGRVYVDEALRHHLVPFSQRSASKSLRTLVRGSSMPLPEGDTVRFFLWWKEGMTSKGVLTGRVDVDLSGVFYDSDWGYQEHISYTNLRSERLSAVHSGDITSAPNGASEFIDISVAKAVKAKVRYVVMNVLSYSQQPFCELPECFAGWMMRQKPSSGEIFEPATVVDRIDLSAETKLCIPAILDLVERRLIWADLSLRKRPNFAVNIESNKRGITHIARGITAMIKPNLFELFDLHATARGERVDSPEEADTVFSVHTGTTPFAIEEIMANYL